MENPWVYLMTDLIVLGLSISYIPLTRIGYSILTVILSGQIGRYPSADTAPKQQKRRAGVSQLFLPPSQRILKQNRNDPIPTFYREPGHFCSALKSSFMDHHASFQTYFHSAFYIPSPTSHRY